MRASARAALATVLVATLTSGCSGPLADPGPPADRLALAPPAAEAPSAEGLLGPPTYTDVDQRPERIVAADLDSDGRTDLILARSRGRAADKNIVLRSTESGFDASSLRDGGPVMSAADLDADGAPDLVAAVRNGGHLSLFRGQGDGGFAAPVRFPVIGSGPTDVFGVDLDSDGDLDLLSANEGSEDVTTLLGDGQGAFTYPTRSGKLTENLGAAAAIDLTGDGSADVALAGSDRLSLARNDGSGQLGNPVRLADDVAYPPFVRSADVNVDGHADLLYADYDAVHLRLGNGQGDFSESRDVPLPRWNGYRFVVGDLNGEPSPISCSPAAGARSA